MFRDIVSNNTTEQEKGTDLHAYLLRMKCSYCCKVSGDWYHLSTCVPVPVFWEESVTKMVMFPLLLLLLSHFSHVRLCGTPETAAHQAPPSLGFSRQEHWSGLPLLSPMRESEKWKWSRSVVSDSSRPHGLQPTRLLHPWDFPGKSTGVGCHHLLRLDH